MAPPPSPDPTGDNGHTIDNPTGHNGHTNDNNIGDNGDTIDNNINHPDNESEDSEPEDETLEVDLDDVPPAATKRELPPRADPDKELLYLVHQFLKQEDCDETAHTLEMEKSFYFDVNHFEDTLRAGRWRHAYDYLIAFSYHFEDHYINWLFYEIYKQIYFEALYNGDTSTAVDIMRQFNPVLVGTEMVKRLTLLLRLNDFREHSELSIFYDQDEVFMRSTLVQKIRDKRVITCHPLLKDKLILPWTGTKDLRTIYREHKVPLLHQLTRLDPDKELLYLVRQFLKQENCEKTLHTLDMEKSLYFDMSHFEEIVTDGEWRQTVYYIQRFTDKSKLFGEINLQAYLEALDSGDMSQALASLKALRSTRQPEDINEFSALLAIDDYKITPSVDSARTDCLHQMKILIDTDLGSVPVLKYKQLLFWVGSKDLRTIYRDYKVGSARRAQSI